MKQGLHKLAAKEYHADPCPVPSLSSGIARILITQTPAHARIAHRRLNPAHEPYEASQLDIGTAAHSLFLEGNDAVMVCAFDDWRKKEAQILRDEARSAGRIPLLTEQYGRIKAMVDTATAAWESGPLDYAKDDGQPELSAIWQEGDTWLRCRPDWMSNDHQLVVDYKTTALPNPEAWMRSIPTSGYDVQQAFYERGLTAINGKLPRFVFMVQEVNPPFPCYFVELPPVYHEIGSQKVESAIQKWKACMKANQWPDYPKYIYEAEPPQWALAEAEELLAERKGFTVEGFLFGSVKNEENTSRYRNK